LPVSSLFVDHSYRPQYCSCSGYLGPACELHRREPHPTSSGCWHQEGTTVSLLLSRLRPWPHVHFLGLALSLWGEGILPLPLGCSQRQAESFGKLLPPNSYLEPTRKHTGRTWVQSCDWSQALVHFPAARCLPGLRELPVPSRMESNKPHWQLVLTEYVLLLTENVFWGKTVLGAEGNRYAPV
jgi:hypothetical protein